MQAYAEGFDIMKNANVGRRCRKDHRYDLDLPDIAEVWRRGSVVGSWLLDLTAMALIEESRAFASSPASSQDSGEGRWTIMAAIEEAVPCRSAGRVAVTRASVRARTHTFAEKMLSAMRYKFGGHVERASGG